MKQYNENVNVYDATRKRLEFIFNEFEKVIVSFSGGKDSGVLLNMAIDLAREKGRKIGVVFIDLEAFYKLTIEYIERMIENNLDVLEPYWIALPMESDNSLSHLDPTWIWWDREKEPVWVREMPTNQWVINEHNNPIDFYKKNMTFEEFVKYFAAWYGQGKKTASLLGIRSDESLNRFRAVSGGKYMYKELTWSTQLDQNTYNFYPIYDWNVEDIWIYNGKYEKDYNKLYDLFYKAGVRIHQMRVDEPFGDTAKAGLNLFKVIEPDTWQRVVNRVSGANFGNIYAGSKINSHRYTLPKNHTWKSFTMFLLDTLPEEARANYEGKFAKFIKYWMEVGCPVKDEYIDIMEKECPDKIINTKKKSNRGKGDKDVILFKEIVDEIPGVDNKDDVLTWKRMAMCIIKNDYLCRGLSFSITKTVTLRQKELVEKYRRIVRGK